MKLCGVEPSKLNLLMKNNFLLLKHGSINLNCVLFSFYVIYCPQLQTY